MSTTASALCCAHPKDRSSSPSPPPRPLPNLDGIFAAAALPEDHPDAVTFPHRKPELEESIVRSPGLGSKIKLHFQRRRSKMSLVVDEGYDDDAKRLGSGEIAQGVPVLSLRRFGSMSPITYEDLKGVEGLVLDEASLRPPTVPDDDAGASVVSLTTVVAAPRQNSDGTVGWERPLPPLPKSFSAPLMLRHAPRLPLCLRRSRSDSGLVETYANDLNEETSHHSGTAVGTIPRLHIRGPTSEGILEAIPIDDLPELKQKASDSALHLHRMGISQQLRCMSQLSDVAEDIVHPASPPPWTFHHRQRSTVSTAIGPARRPRHVSSSGVNSATMPSSWGRVRSPGMETASSVYSRPTSAGGSAYPSETPDLYSPVPPVDLQALFADWPLKPSASVKASRETSAETYIGSCNLGKHDKPLLPTPSGSRKDSGTASFVTAINGGEMGSVKGHSPPHMQHALSFVSKEDVSIKTSNCDERLSPPKKFVRKRRSIFRFLRPGSRKQQTRSTSTPVLRGLPNHNAYPRSESAKERELLGYDGHSDNPALLTVQYELDDRPAHATRSVSMIDFGAVANGDTPSQLPVSHSLQRRPTLADYERSLTVVGDDRRRPSAINVTSAKEMQEDDHRDSVGLRRRISRARPLKDDASPLMAYALEKHQQEKALFRSASKQRESLGSAHTAPVFKSSPFSSGVPTPKNRSEADPMDKLHMGSAAGKSPSSTHLAVPGLPTSGLSTKRSANSSPQAQSFTTTVEASGSAGKKRIGTSLETWSRYPSHDRAERCGSAGRPDNVITRDFAVDVDHAAIHETDEADAASPESKRSDKTKQVRKGLPQSRSMGFSSIVRYYSNLFSSNKVGQNRRTSVTMSGRLEYPELELLPPQLAAEPLVPSHHGALTRLKEHAKEDAERIREFVRDEEEKIEEYVREEEDKFENFVRREEDFVEGFVKKEEGKLKEYVQAEEDALKHHHWRHHSSEHGSTGKESPFREISLFEVPRDHSQEDRKRRDTIAIGPMDDDADDGPTSRGSRVSADGGLTFDGAASIVSEPKQPTASKAEAWSDVYRQCLLRTTPAKESTRRHAMSEGQAMSLPALKPTKTRTPEQPKRVESTATIRRFPSVTVVDDRKGHFRSISLISVKRGHSSGFERSSTHDLLELVQAREREEREKLLKAGGGVEQPVGAFVEL